MAGVYPPRGGESIWLPKPFPGNIRGLVFPKRSSPMRHPGVQLVVLAVLLALAAAVVVIRPGATPPAGPITLESIRYDDLAERIVQLQGRVVVVDFWADYCLPCKKEFPKLVELHRQFAARGFAA